jgi:hypothetical protein
MRYQNVIGGGIESTPDRVTPGIEIMPRWVIFVVGMYVGAALVTLGFQTLVRLEQCSGVGPCATSLAKGIVWSAIWPASWPVYAAGKFKNQGMR